MFNVQYAKVAEMLSQFCSFKRSKILQNCLGTSTKARQNFWSHISPSKKQTSEISAVIDPTSGAIKCNLDEITSAVQDYIVDIYQGSYEKITPPVTVPAHNDHTYSGDRNVVPGSMPDHAYSLDPSPSLSTLDSTSELGGIRSLMKL